VLITAGGTEEPLDGVRRLSNTSTGATGLELARTFAARGAEVHLLHAERITVGDLKAQTTRYLTFDDLKSSLGHLLGSRHFDAVIHLAAVSDYGLASLEVDGRSLDRPVRGKIPSGREVVIRLRPNPKLIDRLRSWSKNPDLRVVGFKLTDDPDPGSRRTQVEALLGRGVADLVVHNDIREIDEGRHLAAIYSNHGAIEKTSDKNELAEALYRLLAAGEPS
jgi:phosphopantothenoylcysteine synthetase/decarboxylase